MKKIGFNWILFITEYGFNYCCAVLFLKRTSGPSLVSFNKVRLGSLSVGLSSILVIVKACNFDSNTLFQIQKLLCPIQNQYFNVCRWKLYSVLKVPMFNSYAFEQGVCHTAALPFTLRRIWRQKKNYENSNISSCKYIISKKPSQRNQNPSKYHSSISNIKFQHKLKYHLSKVLI